MTVNNVNALSPFGAVQGGQTSVKPEEFVQERFDKLMTKMGDQLAGMQQSQVGSVTAVAPKQATVENALETAQPKDTVKQATANQTAEAKKPEDTVKDDGNGAVEQDKSESTAETQGTAQAQDTEKQETVEKAAEELVAQIANVMDIPLEKVEEAMEDLGLTAVDLFDLANLKQLLLNLTDSTDELSLVTDETLYGNLQELFTVAEDTLASLQEELGVSEEELDVLMEQMSAAKQDAVEENPLTQAPEVSVEGMKDYAVSVQKDGGTVQVKVTVDDASGEKHVSEQITETAEPENESASAKADTGRKGEESMAGEQNTQHTFLQNLTGQTEEVEAPAEQPVYTQPETNQIMDQIVEYMKSSIKPETQELEMQLHPASLGTVHVQLAAKDGVITAQFAAQNETVKAVLETQMIHLKQQFEEQGIKVEAVEVTVANHAYGEQFSQEQDTAGQQREAAKKSTRRINLDDLEEDALEEMEDSERIAVEMMQANGSTVDYTA